MKKEVYLLTTSDFEVWALRDLSFYSYPRGVSLKPTEDDTSFMF